MNRPEPKSLFSTLIRIPAILTVLVSTTIFGQVPVTQDAEPSGKENPAKCNSKDVDAAFAAGPEYQERLEKYLVVCREAGNKKYVGWILRAMGDLHVRAGDVDKAIAVWEEALRINEELGNVMGSIPVILSLGSAYRYTKNDTRRAGEYLRKLLNFSDNPEPQYKNLIAGSLGVLAHFEATEGNPQQALIVSDKILILRQEIGDPRGIAGALSQKGHVYSLVGEKPDALGLYRQALIKSEQLDDRALSASILSRMGHLYRQLGYETYALDYFERSFKISEELGISNQFLVDLTDVAYSHYHLGDLHKALEVIKRLLNVLDDLQNDPFSEVAKSLRQRHGRIVEAFTASTLQLTGRLYLELGMFDLSVEFFQRAATNAEKDGDSPTMISTTRSIGEAKLSQGRYNEAIEFFQKSLAFCNSGDGRYRNLGIYPLARIADIYARQAKFAEGREFASRAELLSKQLTGKDGYYPFVMLGGAYISLGDFERARTSLEQAITLAEANTRRIADEEERLKLFERIQDPYKLYIHSVMQLHRQQPSDGFDSIALEWNERARARGLLEAFSQAAKLAAPNVDPKLRSRELDLQRRLNAAAERQDRLQSQTPTAKIAERKEVERLTAELRLTKEQIRKREALYAALTGPQTLSSFQISRELLDDDTALLEYSLGNNRSYVWLVTNSSSSGYELPSEAEIEQSARRVYGLLSDNKRSALNEPIDTKYLQAAEKLSDMILGPVADRIKGKRLVIVADGALQYIPFSALPMPKATGERRVMPQPLVTTNEIVSLPSASVLAVLRREAAGRKQKGGGIAVVADPVFSETDERVAKNEGDAKKNYKDDLSRMLLERALSFSGEGGEAFSIPRLPFTRREAESIFGSAPRNTSIKVLDFDADREKVLMTDLSKYRIVHFATHGILHSEHPDLSGIVLSLVNAKGEPVNGFLRVNEIYNMKLNADLVVLSACQTALGKEVRGEGLIGLTRGFMYAGSPRVVASLWKVDDVATAELMKIFYQKMLKEKMRPAAALREAKIAMMKQKRWRSPYYWAAFELHGDWR